MRWRVAPGLPRLQQPLRPHAAEPVAADDDMIVHGNAERATRFDNLPRDVDVLSTGLGRSARMVVQHARVPINTLIYM